MGYLWRDVNLSQKFIDQIFSTLPDEILVPEIIDDEKSIKAENFFCVSFNPNG